MKRPAPRTNIACRHRTPAERGFIESLEPRIAPATLLLDGGTGESASTADTVSVTIGTASVGESSTTGLIYSFTRTGDTTAPLVINFTADGTALLTTDFTASSSGTLDFGAGTLTIPAGESAATVTLVPVDDRRVEGSETVTLTVAAGSGYEIGGSPATGTFTDNDLALIRYLVQSSSVNEGATTLTLTFRLDFSVPGTGPVSLDQEATFKMITKAGGTATDGVDYTLPGVITYQAGSLNSATRTASITIVNDSLGEGDELANLGLEIVSDATGGRARIATGGFGDHVVTITDNDTEVSVAVNPTSVTEDSVNDLVYTFTRTGVVSAQQTINFNVGGDAVFGSDYTQSGAATFGATTGTVTFAAGATTAEVRVNPATDTNFEANETVSLTVAAGAGYVISTANAATGTIVNFGAQPKVSISDASGNEGNTGTTNLVFTVTLTGTSVDLITVDYMTLDGTAIAPGDYTPVRGTLLFNPGETSHTITVPVFGDATYEDGEDETLFVGLGLVTLAEVDDTLGQGTIINDDASLARVMFDAKNPFTFFDANHDRVTLKLAGPGTGFVSLHGGVLNGADISEIEILGTSDAKSVLSVALKKDRFTGDGAITIGEVRVDGGLKAFTAPAADFVAGGFYSDDAVNAITIRHLTHGGVFLDGLATKRTILKFGNVAAGTLIQHAIGPIASITATNLGGDVSAPFSWIGKITVKAGALSGRVEALALGAVSVTGGDFSGEFRLLNSTDPSLPALKSLTITKGDLTGDISSLGDIGTIAVRGKTVGGSVIGATITATAIKSLHVAHDVTGALILSGADLGDNHVVDGINDTFAPGMIGVVKIGGNVSGATVIAAGLNPVDGNFKDGNDQILGGTTSVMKSFTIVGTAAADSYFAAGLFKTVPKIAKAKVMLPDDRFKTT